MEKLWRDEHYFSAAFSVCLSECPTFSQKKLCCWSGCWVTVSAAVASGDNPPPPQSLRRGCHGNRDKRPQLVLRLCRPGNRCQQPCQLWGNRDADVSSVESTEGWLECGINFFFCLSLSLSLSLSMFLPFHSSFLLLHASFSLFFLPPSFPFSGEEAHHRPVRGPERWTQPDLLARGPLWSHPGMDFYFSLTLTCTNTWLLCHLLFQVTLCSRLTHYWWQSWTTWHFITSMSVNRVASFWAPAVWLMPTRWCKSLSPDSDRQAGPPRDAGWFRGRQVD